jgi:uncharacterized protein DUF5667/putative zinc finger protein
MLSHTTTRDWLIPYADGMLAADERRRIDSHIAGCAACAAELREVRDLNLLLVTLPAAPPVSFSTFWSNLQAVLPQRRALRIPSFPTYRRLGLALAAATVAVLAAAGSALAAPSANPDNPLYAIKQLEESIRLTFTPSNDRLTVQLQLANERLREARIMATNHKPLLAENSLRAFRVTINDAAASLKNPADPRAAKAAVQTLRVELAAVERANAVEGDDNSEVERLVVAGTDELNQIDESEPGTAGPTIVVGEQASPMPTPQPISRPTPQPSSSGGEPEQTSGDQ